MKFGIFERREQKVKKLAHLVAHTEDRILISVLDLGGIDDLALLLRLVPMSRLNPLLQIVPLERLKGAFARLRGNAHNFDGVTDQAISSLVSLLTTPFLEPRGPVVEELSANKDDPEVLDRPVCVRALDFAGKILSGTDE